MDSTADVAPPIPRQARQESRRRGINPALHLRIDRGTESNSNNDHPNIPPASPEIISSLITSLDVISKRASNHFENQSLSVPSSRGSSPGLGSFGIEYGAFSQHPLDRLQEEELDLNELAACPPTIRTAKPPSGFSPLTASKAPKSPRDAASSLKSFLRNTSRPSSKSSASSSHDDAQSIGNLSIERSLGPAAELTRRRSSDSWGKKQARSQKGLMYMNSKERLRATEVERKRLSGGTIGGAASTRADSLLVDTPIDEEGLPMNYNTSAMSPSSDPGSFHASIPTRDSSLRQTGSNAKRSSHRSSRTTRRENDMIPETDEDSRSKDSAASKKRQLTRAKSEADTKQRKDDILNAEMPNFSKPNASGRTRHHDDRYSRDVPPQPIDPTDDDDGAPFPSVYSSRRRSAHSADRMKSGRTTPDPVDTITTKRSSSRLKRLSTGIKSQEPIDRKKESPTPEPMVGYERPGSADSVDDAVESYLCSPRLSQKIRHPQTGRVISFSEVGDAEGSAVFCCVGMGLTRYITAFYDELALTLKLRLITPDRPGVGDSESYADGTATPLSWPDDVYAICQALKITKFSILAHSAGAIYALATALRMPQHIRGRIHLLAPWIPPSQMNTFGTAASPPTNAIPTSQRILRALPTPFLKAANSSFMTATSSSLTSSLPKDKARRAKRKAAAKDGRDTAASNRRDVMSGIEKEMLAQEARDKIMAEFPEKMDPMRAKGLELHDSLDPKQSAVIAAATDAIADKERQVTYDTRLTHAIWDLATTGANPAVDLLVCLERRHTIGFRYVDITRPVVIHHGTRDTRVPVDNVRWLGKTMRRCEVRVLEGEGHGLMASASVMGGVLMEISREWDDWNRVTKGSRHAESEKERERGRSSARLGVR